MTVTLLEDSNDYSLFSKLMECTQISSWVELVSEDGWSERLHLLWPPQKSLDPIRVLFRPSTIGQRTWSHQLMALRQAWELTGGSRRSWKCFPQHCSRSSADFTKVPSAFFMLSLVDLLHPLSLLRILIEGLILIPRCCIFQFGCHDVPVGLSFGFCPLPDFAIQLSMTVKLNVLHPLMLLIKTLIRNPSLHFLASRWT